MLNTFDILSTIDMLDHQHLDIRTVTMGVNLMDCAHPDIDECARRVYDKICRLAGDLLPVCQGIETELGIPIVNKRISVTPVAMVAQASDALDYTPVAMALDRAEALGKGKPILVMMHFPPRMADDPDTSFTRLLEARKDVRTVVYGHLHGPAFAGGFSGTCNGISYYPVSCDGIGFRPREIPWPEGPEA